MLETYLSAEKISSIFMNILVEFALLAQFVITY